ncbi:HAD-IIB family hydrolase [Candidatus Kaiserbacteria bacterium]|nr:HAD-IIB family hydrolase [Candidatus Kaiserbacteria bacterium]
MSKHIFFDLDKTLTASRTPMALGHQALFARLCDIRDVIVVTGGTREQIREQITPQFDGRYYILAQSGNQVFSKDGSILRDEKLSEIQLAAIMRCIDLLKKHFAIQVRDENDTVENRGAQVAYSVLGFHEDVKKKYAFDPDDSRRQAALATFTKEREQLLENGVEVIPAGTTNFSFIPAGRHKGYNVERFRKDMRWEKDDCAYVGDALFPGGNDESVIGVIPTKSVKNPDDTFIFIKDMLS